MINALQNSLNQMSEEEKRRKRKAELQSKINAYEKNMTTTGLSINRMAGRGISSIEYDNAKSEYDRLNY
jgi:hypothetical protein